MAKIDPILDEIVNRGGSDLHLAPGTPPLGRVGGDLVALREGALDAAAVEEMLVELLTPEQRARLEADLELEVTHAHKDTARFRGTYFREARGLGAVFRVVPSRAPSLAVLGCPEVLWRLADRNAGLVLVVGPARAGKSTTLAAMVDHINKTRACHVVTIEDSIELVHDPLRAQITQRQIGVHAPSVEVALRTAARENPDVVLVGELRTAEAAIEAMRLASSGVMVFAVVQANGVGAAIERLLGLFPEGERGRARSALAECLCGIVAQLLVRPLDGNTRIPVHEVLIGSPAVSAAIRDGKDAQLQTIMQGGEAQGMLSLDAALERLHQAGRIASDVALHLARDKEAFSRLLTSSS